MEEIFFLETETGSDLKVKKISVDETVQYYVYDDVLLKWFRRREERIQEYRRNMVVKTRTVLFEKIKNKKKSKSAIDEFDSWLTNKIKC
jgi:hypothetical protein